MKLKVLWIGVLGCCGCQASVDPPGNDLEPPSLAAPPSATDALVDRIWERADPTGLPGVMRIFLSDGTLVLDSCWETHRLSAWRMEADDTLLWQEDGVDIRAQILVLNQEELVLRLNLIGGSEHQRYARAAVPYVCPDMPR